MWVFHSCTSSLLLSLKERDLDTRAETPASCVCPGMPAAPAAAGAPAAASSCWPNSSSTERTSIWYCCCRTASVQMLGFPRTFSSGMGFQKKLRTRRFLRALWPALTGGGGGGAPGGGGGGGGAWCLEASLREEAVVLLLRVWPDPEVQQLPSLLLVQQQQQQLSGSLAADGQLITCITGTEPSASELFVPCALRRPVSQYRRGRVSLGGGH